MRVRVEVKSINALQDLGGKYVALKKLKTELCLSCTMADTYKHWYDTYIFTCTCI